MKKLYCIYITMLYFTSLVNAQQRIIHWVHGFGANTSAWFPVVVASEQGSGSDFPIRNIISNNVTYTGPNIAVNTLSDAGAELRMRIRDFLTTYTGGIGNARASNSYIIAHSQGGLVSRWAADISIPTSGVSNNLKHFGGLVTFGTPHAGAKIATSRFNGNLDIFLNQGCQDLGGAIIENGISNNKYYQVLNYLWYPNPISSAVQSLKSGLCNSFFSKEITDQPRSNEFLSQRILGTLLSSGGTRSVVNDPLLYDYQQNGVIDPNNPNRGEPKLTQLTNTPLQPDIVRVAFYGKEINSQSFVRTLQYMSKPSQALPAFTATDNNEETGAIALLTELRNNLENAAITKDNEANGVSLSSCLWFLPIGWTAVCLSIKQKQINNLREEAAKYRKGYQWLDNSNAQWLGIIGARTQTVSTSGKCYCTFSQTPISVSNQADCLRIGSCYRWEEITTTTIIDEDNDGVVTKSSALAMPGAIPISDADAKMEGSQHMQMRNDPNTKAKLYKLYEGGIHTFFRTF